MSRSAITQIRHRAREIALQLIYELDLRPDLNVDEAIALYPFEDEDEKAFAYASELLRGEVEHREETSELLRENIIGWRPERMVAVDKAAICMALYEGVVACRVPVAVAISEAVELAKTFGTEESGRFVNGVLGRIVRKEPTK